MPTVLVTGANGFLGTDLCKKLLYENYNVRCVVRPGQESHLPEGIELAKIESLDGDTDWIEMLQGVDSVVHLAARVHVMKESTSDPFADYQEVNVQGTERLAQSAAKCGVKRFIFMSSVKVNGGESVTPYREADKPLPIDSYGISKLLAEKHVKRIAVETGMSFVILRPPLIYGPGVSANFLALMKFVDRGRLLPLAGVQNRRSLIYLENMVHAIITCIEHPNAEGNTYFVSDDEDVSTPDLIRMIGAALDQSARLFPVPAILLFILGRLIGKGAFVDRLIGSLTVDISKIKQELKWQPPYTMVHGLQKTAAWYNETY